MNPRAYAVWSLFAPRTQSFFRGTKGRLSLMLIAIGFMLFVGCRSKSDVSNGVGSTNQKESSTVVDTPTVTEQPIDRFVAKGYVGSKACAECHADITARYAGHSMGKSAALVSNDYTMPALDKAEFETERFRYSVEQAENWLHCQSRMTDQGDMAKISMPVSHVIGSGKNGQSYLVNRDGHLLMSPMTWYPGKAIWDLSPGYEKNNSQFNRPVIEQCLYCHTDGSYAVETSINRYEDPVMHNHVIGCERCHGPGKQHLAIRKDGSASKDTIVNPVDLSPALREAVCQQCHLSGAVRVLKPGRTLHDFTPGKSLSSAYTIFTVAEDGKEFVGHVEQMYQSKCFQGASGELGCISCHDPHGLPSAESRITFYQERCLKCHQDANECSEPLEKRQAISKENDCIQCHMPRRRTEIRHAAVTDHSVPRIRDARTESRAADGSQSIAAFPEAFGEGDSGATARDRAIAMTQIAMKNSQAPPDEREFQSAISALEEATKKNPTDYAAAEALAELYISDQRFDKAIQLCKEILDEEPLRETTLRIVSETYSTLGQTAQATPYWERLVQVNPWMSLYWYNLGKTYAARERWNRCLELATAGKERFPTSIGLRQLLVQSLLNSGDIRQAKVEFQEIESFKPAGLEKLQDWFRNHPAN